jgi:hypothetical protein
MALLSDRKPGDEIEVAILREKVEQTFNVKLSKPR